MARMIKAHLKYLSYVLRHKWYVFAACVRLGVPLRGLLHDLSKFRPSEWCAYTKFFYGGGADSRAASDAFDVAWLFHQHRNPHHWQYWVLQEDSGPRKVLDMPRCYAVEMVADWVGAGKAITGEIGVVGWYRSNREKIALGVRTLAFVEGMISLIDRAQEDGKPWYHYVQKFC